MKNPSESAIAKHYLAAILPHPVHPVPKQILKTNQFYQPEKFIWNNPHRSSSHMFKFYHAYNQHYAKNKQQETRRQEDADRQAAQKERIHRVIAFRTKTREEFARKQKDREQLQARTVAEQRGTWKSVKTDHNLGIQSQRKNLGLNDDNFRKTAGKEALNSDRLIRIEATYKEGLKKYDVRTQEVYKLIKEQREDWHRDIRSEFMARKNNNDSTNTHFYSKVKRNNLLEKQGSSK